jgi:hypothetical protein
MHLITQPVHVPPCSNSAMKGNNGTNRILYHDIAAKITEPPRVSCWNQAFRVVGFLGCSPNVNFPDVGNSVKDNSSDHTTRAFPVVWLSDFRVLWS